MDEPVDPQKRYPNPSFGLVMWGPLVPANDCRPCMYACVGLQFLAGASLWYLPGNRPPPGRPKWRNRSIKAAGVMAGTYLMLYSFFEGMRYLLPYDPWVADAEVARMKEPARNVLDIWRGPRGYRAVSVQEWGKRADAYLDEAEQKHHQRNHGGIADESKDGVSGSSKTKSAIAFHVAAQMRQHNRKVSAEILQQLKNKTFDPPVPVESLSAQSIDPELYELLEQANFDDLNHWRAVELAPFSLVVLPQTGRPEDPDRDPVLRFAPFPEPAGEPK